MTRRKDPTEIRIPVAPEDLPAFEPVPRKAQRHDGWTPERQRAFQAEITANEEEGS